MADLAQERQRDGPRADAIEARQEQRRGDRVCRLLPASGHGDLTSRWHLEPIFAPASRLFGG
jgi:hypothetical protein